MDAEKEPLRALPYAEPSSPLRVADLVCHVVFAAGVGLVLGGASAIFYHYDGLFMEWYPHIITLGGFMVGLVLSLRWGRVLK
jgi:hypothetical protein